VITLIIVALWVGRALWAWPGEYVIVRCRSGEL
jgi:hypothetical protein